jgi:hypothetical protein
MAKLEFYRQQVVPRIATPSGRGLAAVGAQAVQTAEAVTRGVDAFGRLQADLDELRVEDTFNKLRQQQTDLMMNPETGFANKRSADATAPDFISKYTKDFDKAIENLATSLPGNRAQEMFRRRASMAKAEYDDSLMRHVLRETDQYRDDVYTGAIATETNSAALNWRDLAKIKDSLGRVVANTALWADRKGLAGDALMAQQIENVTKIHSAVIQSALDAEDYTQAKAYFDANRGQMTAAAISASERALEQGGTRDQSLKLALQLSGSGIGLDAQRKQLKDMFTSKKISADVYDQTLQRISAEAQLAKANEADWNNSMSGQAQDWVLNNPGKSIADLPPRLYNWAKGKGQLDNLSRFAASAGDVKGNDAEFTRLFILGADNPTQFLKEFDENSSQLQLTLSRTQYNSLLTRRGSIGKGDLAGQVAAKVAAGTVRSLRSNLIAAGIDVTPKEGSPQAETLASFEGQLIESIEAKTQEVGRALTLDESRKLGLDLMKEGRLIGAGFFGGDVSVRKFAVTPEQQAEYQFIGYEYGEIPAADRQRIENIITARKDLQKTLGVKVFSDGRISRPNVQRAVELLYQAELDGVTY